MDAARKSSLDDEIEELVSWLPWFERRKDYPTPYKIAFRALTVLAALSTRAEGPVPSTKDRNSHE